MPDHPEEIRRLIDSVDPVTADEVRARAEAEATPDDPRPLARRRKPALVLGGVALAAVIVVIVIATRSPSSSTVDTTQVGSTIPTTVVSPPGTMLVPVGDDPEVTCKFANPNWFRVSAWSGPVSGRGLDLPAAVVLQRQYVINDMAKTNGAIPPYPDVPITSWRLLSADESEVLWGLGDLDMDQVALDTIGPNVTFVRAELVDGEWQSAGGGGGSCNELYVRPPEGSSIGWWALTAPLDPETTAFAITIGSMDICAGSLDADDILGPDITETTESVSIRVAVDRPSSTTDDYLDCRTEAGPPEPSTVTVMVQLSAPLGDRTLLDANVFPAAVVSREWQGSTESTGTTEPP